MYTKNINKRQKQALFFGLLMFPLFLCVSFFLFGQIVYASEGEISNNKDLILPATNGIITYFFELISGGLADLVKNFSSQFSPLPDSDYFFVQTQTGSVSNSFFDFFNYLGYFLTFTVFAISMIMVALSGFFDNKNRAIELLVRLLVGGFLIYWSRDILDVINEAFENIWEQIKEVEPEGDYVLHLTSTAETWKTLLVLVLLIAFIIEFVKFVLEIMERYIVVKLLYISSPSVNGLVVSRTTSSIVVNFYRMYFSQLLLLLFNRFFSFLLCAMVAHVLILDGLDVTAWLFLIATCKAAQRVDSYMKAMGLTVAQTGSAVLDSVMGAVSTLGKGWGLAKNGAGFIGAAQMNLGAATGDYGLFKAGMNKQAFAKGGITGAIAPKSESQALKEFAAAGGGKAVQTAANKTANKAALSRALTESYNRGNYGTLGSYDSATQTIAARNILSAGPGGDDAFRKATGFNASDIQSAHFNSKGDIEGTIRTGENGQVALFKVSSDELKGRSGSIECSDGQTRNIQTRGTVATAPEHGAFEHTEGGVSNLSTMTGLELDDTRLSELGATDYMIDRDDNMLYVANESGDVVYARGLETGNEMWASQAPPDKSTGSPVYETPDVGVNDFTPGGKLEDYAPQGVLNVSRHHDRNSVDFKTKPTSKNSTGSTITVTGVNGSLKNINSGNGSDFRYDGRKINLNDKNIKLIDNREKGTYAVISRDNDTRKKVKV